MATTRLAALIEAMEEARRQTLALLEAIPDDRFAQREGGEWSPAMVLHHLLIAETGVSKVIRKVLKERAGTLPPYPADDSGFRVREPRVPPGGMKAPEAAVPRETPPRPELLALAAETRARTRESLAMLAPFDPTAASFPHPLFGEMTLYEWIAVVLVEHERQHHGQISAVAGAPARGEAVRPE